MEDGHCVRTIHAEVNAIAQAASNGVSVHGAAIYITASPCWPCFKLIVGAGVRRIAFGEFYRDEKIFAAALRGGVELVDLTGVFRPVEIDPGAKKVTNTDIARGYVGGGRHEPGGMLDPNSKDD
jgi:dCMP deaminase